MEKSMSKTKRKASVADRIVRGLKEFAEALDNEEPISERFTCRTIVLKLRPAQYDAAMVQKTRELLGASQAVFAQFLGVSTRTVHAWEQEINTPSEMASRFMDEIRRDPRYWQERLKRAAVAK
jgi:putative transcriptional regulator